ncbi:LysR family transcriptional regulator [Marinomonas sp. PE14-40]|uniref:LysR family transcriptional regulator n=1 Tax=Marinomonas sp. PE14-40 TaxID=3060621 RepID=UPI003F670D89
MLNQLRQIAIFAKTVEHGSFRKAALALQLSPSVVSHHIANLEEELGVALLYRSTRKLSLTSDGERLLISARAMINGAEDFLKVATDQKKQLIGELNITLPAVLERSEWVNHISSFSKLHKGVNLQLNFSDTQSNLIQDGIDVAIRMGTLKDSGLKARKFYDIERMVVASADYLKHKPNQFKLEDLENWDWIELSPIGLNNIFSFPVGSNISFRPKSRIRVNNAHAIHHIVVNGNGVAALPKFLVEKELENGTLIRLLPNLKIKSIGVYAVWPPNAPKNGLTARLIEHLKKNIW